MSKVSIIIPSMNVETYVSECIESIIGQSYQNFEIIFVDSSSDNTPVIIDDYRKKHPDKIKYYFQEKKGPSAARNYGILNSTGKYIAFLDSDDILDKYSIEKRLKKIESGNNYSLVYTDTYILLNRELQNTNYKNLVGSFYEGYVLQHLIINNFICTSTVLLKKDVFDKTGLFDETLKCVEDYELWLRISLNRNKIGLVDEPLTYYRIRKGSLSEDNTKRIETLINVFNRIKVRNISLDENEKFLILKNIKRYHNEYFIFKSKSSLIEEKYVSARKYYSYTYKFNKLNLKYYIICSCMKYFPQLLRYNLKNRMNHRGFKY